MFIIVAGGGTVGYYLTRELLAEGHEVVLLEKDPKVAARIAEELGPIVLARDACEGRWLAEAGVVRADAVIAVTGDDEDNLIICQMAKFTSSTPVRTIARVKNPKNEWVLRQLGVDAT
ncbi:MAG: portal protein, partial [Chloroflexota bacterium]